MMVISITSSRIYEMYCGGTILSIYKVKATKIELNEAGLGH